MMARRFERGFGLIERCQDELPFLAADFAHDSAMREALEEIVEAARRVDRLLRRAGREVGSGPPGLGDA